MKILHLTNHIGTTKSINAVFKQLDMTNNLITEKCYDNYYINKTEANHFSETYKEKIKEYDVIIFTDTSMTARPFLQNIDHHNCIIIVYITNRFDWGMFGFRDEEYYHLYSELSRHPRVFFCADNTYDQYYATQHNIHFFYNNPIKLIPNLVIDQTIDQQNQTQSQTQNKNKMCIFDRGTPFEIYKIIMNELQIEYDIFGEKYKPYRDVTHICEYKGILHLPYQTNIQSLWENLGYNIIYFIPSKKFIYELIRTTNWYYWEEKTRSPELFVKSIELSEWYIPENEILFVYFDSWENLKDKLNNITHEEMLEKKTKISEFMKISNMLQLEKWKKILKI